MRVPYRIVVEPQEAERYAAVIDPAKILVLPFSNLGQGSIPARNWIWEHAAAVGAERHWILDDNIRGFYRYNRNFTAPVVTGTIFAIAEEFVDRYENVAEAGFHYEAFMHWTRERNKEKPPFYLNTRVYSCILLRTDLTPWKSFVVHFRSREDFIDFTERLGLAPLAATARSAWFPARQQTERRKLRYVDDERGT
jgi:hypothetical protein